AEAEKAYVDERKETLKAAKASEGKAKEDPVDAEALKAEKAAQAETRSVSLSEYQSLEVAAGDKLSDGRVSQDELKEIVRTLETQQEEALVQFQSSQSNQKEENKDKLTAISLKLEDVGAIMSRFNESETPVNPFAPTEDSAFSDILTRGPEKRFI
ncbi:MAG: hypothetical protein K2X66_08225, partial [Cyanobacteria bacterium]|nr:hypothetical protein [Cyanobacteriota bacterium]